MIQIPQMEVAKYECELVGCVLVRRSCNVAKSTPLERCQAFPTAPQLGGRSQSFMTKKSPSAELQNGQGYPQGSDAITSIPARIGYQSNILRDQRTMPAGIQPGRNSTADASQSYANIGTYGPKRLFDEEKRQKKWDLKHTPMQGDLPYRLKPPTSAHRTLLPGHVLLSGKAKTSTLLINIRHRGCMLLHLYLCGIPPR